MTATRTGRAGDPAADRPATGVYAVDPVHTFVVFSARHLVIGRFVGRLDRLNGTLTVTERLEDWTVNRRSTQQA